MQRSVRCILQAALISSSLGLMACSGPQTGIATTRVEQYFYADGSLHLEEMQNASGDLLRSTWYTKSGDPMLSVDWEESGMSGFYFYFDLESGGIRAVEQYHDGVRSGRVDFVPPSGPPMMK